MTLTLAFRQRVAAAFAAELGDRVYDLAYPPDAATPLAVYRQVGPTTGPDRHNRLARVQLTVRHESYSEARRLQRAIERYLGGLRSTWLGPADGPDDPVWVYLITPITMPDQYQAGTRMRLAVSEFLIRHAECR